MALRLTIAGGRALRALPLALAAECQYVSGSIPMTADSLERLCRDLERPSRPDPDDNARIAVLHAGDELHVDYFGYTFDEAFERLSALLATRMLAERLASLQLRTPDEARAAMWL